MATMLTLGCLNFYSFKEAEVWGFEFWNMKVIALIALVFSCSYGLVNGKVELLTYQAGFADSTAAGEGNSFLPGETFIEDSSGG